MQQRKEAERGVDAFIQTLKQMGVHDELKQEVMSKYGATLAQVFGTDRMKHISVARQAAMFFIRERFQWSYPAIGNLFNRDHTTVIASIRQHKKRTGQT